MLQDAQNPLNDLFHSSKHPWHMERVGFGGTALQRTQLSYRRGSCKLSRDDIGKKKVIEKTIMEKMQFFKSYEK